MNPSDNLYQLIRSMTTAEKRYFTSWAKPMNDKLNYLALFEILNKQKEYNHQQIKEFFNKDKSESTLSSGKRYLYKLILKSLRQYRSSSSIKIPLKDMLDEAEILLGKTLYSQAEKVLQNAKRIARLHELFPILLQIIEMELIINMETMKADVKVKNLAIKLNEERIELLTIMNTDFNLSSLNDAMFLLMVGSVNLAQKERLQKADNLIGQVKLHEEKLKSFLGRLRFYTAHAHYSKIINNNEDFRHWLGKVMNLYSEYPWKKEISYDYKLHLKNYISACLVCNKLEDIPALLEEYKGIPVTNMREEAALIHSMAIMELNYYFATGQFTEILNALPYIEEKFPEIQDKVKISSNLTLAYNIAVAYFLNADFKGTIKWVRWILDRKHINIREDIQSVARLLQMIIYLEYNDVRHFRPFVLTAMRYKKKSEYETNLENIVLKYFDRLDNMNWKDKGNIWLKGLHSELSGIDVSKQKSILGYEEIFYWVESRLTDKPMIELLLKNQ